MTTKDVSEVEHYLLNHPAVRKCQPIKWANDFSFCDFEISLFQGKSWEDFFLEVLIYDPVQARELCNGIIRFSF